MALLSNECDAKNPIVSRCYESFRIEHTKGTLTEYISQLRTSATHAEMADLQANDFICLYALATCKDMYHSVKEKALELAPEELTLDKLIALARSNESASAALQDMKGSPSTKSTHSHGRGSNSGRGNGNGRKPPPIAGMADYNWEHIKKLRVEKKCTRCAQSIDRCPN